MARAKGEGSVYFEKRTQRWVGAISWMDSEGKRQRKRVRAKTQKEAAARIAQLEAEREGQRSPHRKRTTARSRSTLGYFLETWLETAVVPVRRPKTVRTYAYQVRQHITPALGHIALRDLGPRDIQRYLNALRQKGLSASTVDQSRRVLSAALHTAEEWGEINDVPLRGVTKPRGPKRDPVVLTVPQIRTLLTAAEERAQLTPYTRGSVSPWLHPMIAIAATVGARQGEILGLRWKDVELDTGVLHIRGQLQRGRVYSEVKTSDTRAVVLPSLALRALVQWAGRQAQDAEKAGALWKNTGYVFTSQSGNALDAAHVYRAYKTLAQSAGMPEGLTFHDLRHTATTLMAESGVHQRLAMAILGHKRASTTAEIYTHVSAADLTRDVAAIVDARLGG